MPAFKTINNTIAYIFTVPNPKTLGFVKDNVFGSRQDNVFGCNVFGLRTVYNLNNIFIVKYVVKLTHGGAGEASVVIKHYQ